MSQNVFLTSSSIGRVLVRAGWDNPLQELFCSVEPIEAGLPQSGKAPACLLQTSYLDVAALVASLHEAQIVLPKKMIEAIQLDVVQRAGNVRRVFHPDGSAH
jgi:hypothetical protein